MTLWQSGCTTLWRLAYIGPVAWITSTDIAAVAKFGITVAIMRKNKRYQITKELVMRSRTRPSDPTQLDLTQPEFDSSQLDPTRPNPTCHTAVFGWVNLNRCVLLHVIKGDYWRQVGDCLLGLYHQWWKNKTQKPPKVVCEVIRLCRNPERSSSPSSIIFYINYFQKTACFILTVYDSI